jgi:hypothetical protein
MDRQAPGTHFDAELCQSGTACAGGLVILIIIAHYSHCLRLGYLVKMKKKKKKQLAQICDWTEDNRKLWMRRMLIFKGPSSGPLPLPDRIRAFMNVNYEADLPARDTILNGLEGNIKGSSSETEDAIECYACH